MALVVSLTGMSPNEFGEEVHSNNGIGELMGVS
jgi:hypothetical protein